MKRRNLASLAIVDNKRFMDALFKIVTKMQDDPPRHHPVKVGKLDERHTWLYEAIESAYIAAGGRSE